MPITFDSYLVRPLLMGGVGQIQTAVTVTGDTLKRIVVKIGSTGASAWDDASLKTVDIPLNDSPGDGSMLYASFYGAMVSDAVVASWFAELESGGWQTGPQVTGVDLTPKIDALFPWLKQTIIALLQQGLSDAPPVLKDGRQFTIRGAFPRDSRPLPTMSVQMTAVPTGIQVLGDSGEMQPLFGKTSRKVRGYNINVDLISWTDNPEEREILAPWIGAACMNLVEVLPYFGAHEPTFSVNESEDFDTFKVPAFLVTGNMNFTAFSDLSFPVPTSYGHLTLKQEAP